MHCETRYSINRFSAPVYRQALQATSCDLVIFKRIWQLCGWLGLLPTSHAIPGRLIQTTEHPVTSGGFADVWEGIYNNKRVAIKAFRVYKDEDVQRVRKVVSCIPIPFIRKSSDHLLLFTLFPGLIEPDSHNFSHFLVAYL